MAYSTEQQAAYNAVPQCPDGYKKLPIDYFDPNNTAPTSINVNSACVNSQGSVFVNSLGIPGYVVPPVPSYLYGYLFATTTPVPAPASVTPVVPTVIASQVSSGPPPTPNSTNTAVAPAGMQDTVNDNPIVNMLPANMQSMFSGMSKGEMIGIGIAAVALLVTLTKGK